MPPRTKPQIRHFKAIITPIFVERDQKGEIVREYNLEPIALYLPDFEKFQEKMDEALEAAKQQLAAQQNGSGA